MCSDCCLHLPVHRAKTIHWQQQSLASLLIPLIYTLAPFTTLTESPRNHPVTSLSTTEICTGEGPKWRLEHAVTAQATCNQAACKRAGVKFLTGELRTARIPSSMGKESIAGTWRGVTGEYSRHFDVILSLLRRPSAHYHAMPLRAVPSFRVLTVAGAVQPSSNSRA